MRENSAIKPTSRQQKVTLRIWGPMAMLAETCWNVIPSRVVLMEIGPITEIGINYCRGQYDISRA
jgi:hypothetical protein